MRTLPTALALLVATPVLGSLAIAASYLGLSPRPGNFLDKAPRWWARSALAAAGVEVVLHGTEHVTEGEPHIYVSNHVSWFDVLALLATLPHCRFVAKAEIFRVPIFGRGALAVGTIPIERENRKSAFESYRVAAERIREGSSVVVYPEGTRGSGYALRPFKKGPFVLAVAAGVPVVPTVILGTVEVLARGSFWVRSGRIDVHFLPPVPTAGLVYDDRDQLMRDVYARMAGALAQLKGVDSPALVLRGAPDESPDADPDPPRTAIA